MKTGIPAAVALLSVPLALSSQAATVWNSTTGGDWNNAANWTNGIPLEGTVADPAIINAGRTSNVNSNVANTAGAITVGNQNAGSFAGTTLNINAGGTLNSSGTLTIANSTATADQSAEVNVVGGTFNTTGSTNINTFGTINVTSGSFTTTQTVNVNGELNVNGGNFVNNGGRPVIGVSAGTVNISDGNFTANGTGPSDGLLLGAQAINISGGVVNMTGGQVQIDDETTLSVIGDAATINMDRLNLSNAAFGGTLRWVFDSDGVSTINNSSFTGLVEGSLIIDGTNYTGPGGVFTLLDTTNLATISSDVSVFGFDGYTAVLTQDQAVTDDVFITITANPIPEPASLSLLGIGGTLMLGRRRRSA